MVSEKMAEEDWHMSIESFQYFIILFRVNQVFIFYHFIGFTILSSWSSSSWSWSITLIYGKMAFFNNLF